MKKIICLFLAVLIIIPQVGAFAADTSLPDMIQSAAEYICGRVDSPTIGSIGGEWAILGLARSDASVPDGYFSIYKNNLASFVKSENGVLHERKYTEYSRVVIALTAIGEDPRSFEGFDLTLPLEDFDKTVWQGINGPVWALIALECGGYGSEEIRGKYIEYILSLEFEGGGWAMSKTAGAADVDVTAMVLTALAPYREISSVNDAVERGILFLSDSQNENGGFASYGVENSESAAQVLTAISALGIPYSDGRFVKNGNTIPDYLNKYLRDGGFAHTGEDTAPNLMATEQCLYALVAAERLESGKTSLFDMSDVLKSTTSLSDSKKLDEVSKTVIKYPGKTFEDIKDDPSREAIEALAERGVINGMNETEFMPDGTMTRAQFATITVSALSLPGGFSSDFEDVKESDWFFSYINTAYHYGIIKGVSDGIFDPRGLITREQAAVMIKRAASLCGLDTDMSGYPIRDILSEFTDYTTVSDWAADAVAYCFKERILDNGMMEIKPREAVTRSEIAQMIYNMLGKAELL